jgi:hypothetical protein
MKDLKKILSSLTIEELEFFQLYIEKQIAEKKINWSKPQLLKYCDEKGIKGIVYSKGTHDSELGTFSGTVVLSRRNFWGEGTFCNNFVKSDFKLVQNTDVS